MAGRRSSASMRMAKLEPPAVNDTRAGMDVTTAKAKRELADLRQQIEEARAALHLWRQALVDAEQASDGVRSAQLIEANEQLILAALDARTEVDATSQALEELARSKGFDALTGLPNRAQLLDRFPAAIASAKHRGTPMALLFLDLDNFKHINDTSGHAVGDEVLKLVAQRLASAVRREDTVCRYGGDEFLILLTEITQPSDAALVADKLIAALATPGSVGEHVFRLNACIGICIYPDDGEDPKTLIALADAAMYRAKREQTVGSSYVFVGAAPAAAGGQKSSRPGSLQTGSPRAGPASADYPQHHAQLREANTALILAALDAQTLQGAAERLLRQQKDALAVVAHELRTPLTPIRIASDMLGRVRPEEMQRYQAIIESEIEHMVAVISDLLDVSRFETGKLQIDRQSVDLASVVTAAVDACEPAMDERRQQLTVDMPVQRMELDADPIRLAQILRNLLDNASRYTPTSGQIALSVAVDDDNAVIRVADNGIGITAEALGNVFEPFTQEVHAMHFNGVGLGLGLAVVRELVAAHDGSVVATSEGLGRGTQFVVTLPLAHYRP